jgi:ABC-type Fe3+/spermidine/putrescine transport system ATPase subunit
MAVLGFDGVGFSYAEAAVLAGVSFEAQLGELLVILGPSGSGKSTVLRLAAGLDAPNAGTIYLNGRPASTAGRILMEPADRRISLVFQELALWPHLSADQQLHFTGPALHAADRQRLLRDVGLEGLETRLPAHMSGGERQRLALARALAAGPRALLLDEPFANLDPGLRLELRRLLRDLKRRHRVSIVYVTHDLEDAFDLADRIAVLKEGRIEQTGPPEEIYRRPANAFVATFVGKAIIVSAKVEGSEIHTPLGNFSNPRSDLGGASEVEVVLRPEDIEVGEGDVQARVEEVVFGGDRYLVRASTESGPIWTYASDPRVPGETVGVRVRHGWPLQASRE